LKASLIELREREKLFIKSQTLQEQADKARTACDKLEDSLEVVKKSRADLKQKRAEILRSALDPLAQAVTSLLPMGRAIIYLDDHLFIGWENEGRVRPYQGLSGGEKVFFDGALSAAMLKGGGQKILVLEAGELDDSNLVATLKKISTSHPEAQIIMNTCHSPAKDVEGWKVVKL
jgi:hypothetical protein